MKWFVSLAILVLTLAVRAGEVRADEVTDGLARCWALASAGNRSEACPCFAALEKAYPRPNVTLDRAKCEDQRGEVLEAVRAYERARPGYAKTPEELAGIDARLAALTPKLSRLVLERGDTTKLEGLRVSIDGAPIAFGEQWMSPGVRKLVLERGEKHVDTPLTLERGKIERLIVPSTEQRRALLPVETAPPKPEPIVPTESASPLLPIGITVLGVGVAGVIGAVVTGAMILDAETTAESEGCISVEKPDSGFSCPTTATKGRDAVETGATLVPVNYVMWGVAIAGVGAGIPLVIAGVADDDVRVQAGLGSISIRGRF